MKHFFSIVTFILIFISAHASSGNTLLFKEGKATIIVEDHLSHPLYWWPTTLLTYDIIFDSRISKTELALINEETNNRIPFQLSDIETIESGSIKARLHFMTDLPSGKRNVLLYRRNKMVNTN